MFRKAPRVLALLGLAVWFLARSASAQPIGAIILYPMIALSGLFVPVESLPPALHAMARVLPLTYAVSLLQGIWTGDPWSAHVGDIAALGLVFVVCTTLSAKVFRWE